MIRNVLVIASALAVACIPATLAGTDRAPVRAKGARSTVLMAAGDTPITIVIGDNVIDKPHAIKCANVSGCLIAFAPSLQTDGGGEGVYVCEYIDGRPAGRPKCDAKYSEFSTHA